MTSSQQAAITATVVLIEVAGRLIAVPALDVSAVIELDRIVPTPGAPDHVTGLAAMRSRAITVIDVRRAVGIKSAVELDSHSRFPVVEIDGQGYALACDRVVDIAQPRNAPGPVPPGVGREWQAIATGCVEMPSAPALLIDLEKLVDGASRSADREEDATAAQSAQLA